MEVIMNFTILFGFLSVLSYCVYFTLFITIHSKNREYDIFKHALSDYDIGSTHKLFQIYNLFGILGVLFLAGDFFLASESGFHNLIPVLLILMAVCRIGLSIFKTNIEGEKFTFSAAIHYLFAIGSFALTYIIIDKVDTLLLKQNLTDNIGMLIRIYGYVITIFLAGVCVTMFKPLRFCFAIIERLYILFAGFWFFAIGLVFALTGKL
jgi:hypothetical protein